ncbi:hypothetical protein HYFRA_00013867 [Hymenoscyphus fraxineus]|uniref:Putative phospholipase n=1 Tax=Hymenoscyphus fraxineus TaxID=746836 RepID=A0A9N9LAI2_9HELO|nr:hypothetical protein HYFRA_00013867 [Hymenoscyphus fraxineus]
MTQYRDDFELGFYDEEAFHHLGNPDPEPDAPLPLLDNANTTRPRWLQNTPTTLRTRLHRFDRILRRKMENVRPRWMSERRAYSAAEFFTPQLTVGYVLLSTFFIYVLYCYIVGSPLLASKLPKYTGMHQVGTIDLEVPVQEPREINPALLKNGKPAFKLDTVLFSLYFPTERDVKSTKPKHKWFPKPISLIAEGYSTAAHFNNFFGRRLFTFALWGLASSIDIPAKVDVPLLGHSKEGGDEDLQQYPVVIFSHGDVSSRTDYTAYCGELASRGVVVAAIEHRDGSCPGSIVHLPNGKTRNVMLFRSDQLEQQKEQDEEAVNDDWRFQKLEFRDAEITETISVLQRLHAGEGEEIFKANYREEGKYLGDWKDRLDFSHLAIAGHSFGATGALQALKTANKTTPNEEKDTNPAIGGIIFDPGKSSGRLNTNIDVPLMIVHSDSWSKAHTIFYGRPHFDTVRDIAREVLKRVRATWFMTSMKTSHPSITDAPLIEPLLLSWTTGATINVKEGLREYVRVSMEFLQYIKEGERKGVLDIGVTHEQYGNDTRTDEQKRRMGKGITQYWEVHVAPPAVA